MIKVATIDSLDFFPELRLSPLFKSEGEEKENGKSTRGGGSYDVVKPLVFSEIEKGLSSTAGVFSERKQFGKSHVKDMSRALALKALSGKERELTSERQTLAAKFFKDGLSRAETIKLEYLNWQLDLLEDAQNGKFLDTFESLVASQEQLAKRICGNLEEIKRSREKKPGKVKRR